MNRALLSMTRPEFYAEWAARAREAGGSEEGIDSYIAEQIRIARALLEGKCPKCGAPSARHIDYERQQGPSEMPGVWVMYRCSTAPPPGQLRGDACDFMMDLKEGEEAN